MSLGSFSSPNLFTSKSTTQFSTAAQERAKAGIAGMQEGRAGMCWQNSMEEPFQVWVIPQLWQLAGETGEGKNNKKRLFFNSPHSKSAYSNLSWNSGSKAGYCWGLKISLLLFIKVLLGHKGGKHLIRGAFYQENIPVLICPLCWRKSLSCTWLGALLLREK